MVQIYIDLIWDGTFQIDNFAEALKTGAMVLRAKQKTFPN